MGFNSAFKGLIDKLSHSSYMFRHYCVILSEFVGSCWSLYKIKKKYNLRVVCMRIKRWQYDIWTQAQLEGVLVSTANCSWPVPLLPLYHIPLVKGTALWEQHTFPAVYRLLREKIPENSYHAHSNACATNYASGCDQYIIRDTLLGK